MGHPPPGRRVGGVELNQRGPGVVGVEQHGLGGGGGVACGAFSQQAGIARILDVDHAEMARRPEQALGRFGVLDGDDAVGDLDQRAGEMARLDLVGREGVGQIFAGAAEIEQEIDAARRSD